MSLEEEISSLAEEVRELSVSIGDLISLMEMAQGIEAGQLEMEGKGYLKDSEPEETESAIPMPEDIVVVAANHREIELVKLSKEMGLPHLLNDGKLIVDNRVLDEFNRRNLDNME